MQTNTNQYFKPMFNQYLTDNLCDSMYEALISNDQ